MTEPSKNAGKTVDGKFARGNHYGRGRPEGSRNKASLAAQTLLEGEAEALTRKAIDLALSGDITALRLCLERLLPPAKGRPVRLNMPDIKTGEDVLRAYSAMLKAMSDAHITPDEASTVSGVLDQNRRALETVEIEERIAALEKKIGEQK